ncbi:MAG: VOC family protein [Alphaproteobacteria bacterium]|nr:VOC family protein [Alphaproteobacteria bacterium]
MIPRVNLITLAVADLAVSRAFYERLGWKAKAASNPYVAFFDLDGVILSLYGKDALAGDTGIADAKAGCVTMAINLESQDAVDAAMAEAMAAGATLLTAPHDTPWGGYVGYFADPDGHPWELACVPMFPFDANGRLILD